MSDDLPKDAFDEFLTRALTRRPELAPHLDLASEALIRVQRQQVQEARLMRLARVTRWARIATFAAAALIALTIAIGYRFLPAATTTADSATSTTTTTSTSVDMTTVGLVAFVITLIMVALATLFSPDRPQLRLTPG